jgi:hypothetical protein
MQIGRLIFAAVLATLTLAYFLWKYRKVGGAISFIGYLFGATGAAYAIRQRHKFRQEVGPQPQGFPVLPVPGQVNGKTVLPGGQDPGAYAPNPQDINGGRVAA